MKRRKFLIGALCALVLLTAVGATAWAASASPDAPEIPDVPENTPEESAPTENTAPELPRDFKQFKLPEGFELPEDFDPSEFAPSGMQDMLEKWNSLSDEQKAELNAILGDSANQILDKLLEWGVVTEEEAQQSREALEGSMSVENFFGRMGGKGGGMMRGGRHFRDFNDDLPAQEETLPSGDGGSAEATSANRV
ncbi:MAG: hypothetical protein LBR85_07620 [Oscillospiraceae bacterium]|nr:hypothetical protein [Oscillospiraceae bacterium]